MPHVTISMTCPPGTDLEDGTQYRAISLSRAVSRRVDGPKWYDSGTNYAVRRGFSIAPSLDRPITRWPLLAPGVQRSKKVNRCPQKHQLSPETTPPERQSNPPGLLRTWAHSIPANWKLISFARACALILPARSKTTRGSSPARAPDWVAGWNWSFPGPSRMCG